MGNGRTPSRHAAAVLGFGALLSASGSVAAPDFEHTRYRLVLNGLSYHYDTEAPREQLRETNTGIGVEARWPAGLFAMAATYKDSYHGDAWLAGVGKRWPWWRSEGGSLYIAGGILAGATYRRWEFGDPDRDLLPGLLPFVTLGAGPIEANVSVAPKIPDVIDDPAVAVNFSIQIN